MSLNIIFSSERLVSQVQGNALKLVLWGFIDRDLVPLDVFNVKTTVWTVTMNIIVACVKTDIFYRMEFVT